MSSVRVVALLFVVGLACWLIWPDDPPTSDTHGDSTSAIATTSSPHVTAQPALPTDDDGHDAVLVVDEKAERVRVEGLVIDEQKAPLGGAIVRLGARETTAEADGSFALDDVPAGDIVLRAERGEWYGEKSTSVDSTSEPIEIVVRRGSTLVLRVVSATSGKPIAHAKVDLANRELYTNAEGRLRARGLDPTGERFTISAEGFATMRVNADFDTEQPTAQKEMTVKLQSGAPVSGIVVDERGDRVVEASVSIIAVDNSWSDSTIANERGEFTLSAIGPGKHAMYASSKEHIAKPEQLIQHDGVHPLTGVVIHVIHGAELVGRVVDSAGKPVEGASIRGATGGTTDADGRFVSTGLDPGDLTVSAYIDHRASEEKKVKVAPGKRTEVELVVRDSSLAGRIVDTKGTPIADAQLWARATDDSNSFFATSDEYGKFDFGGMPPGDYRVIAQHEEEAQRRLPQDAKDVFHTGNRDLTIVMPSLSTITGRVVLDGAPVPYFGVLVTKEPENLYSDHVATISDDTGAFAQKDIAPGTWSVVILGPSFATKVVPNVIARENGTTDLGTIVVDRGRIVRGRVTDMTGAPVANALVVIGDSLFTLASNRVDQRTQGDASTRTDANGRYELAGIKTDDTVRIVARAAPRTSVERTIEPTETEVDLVLEDVGSVAGHIANMQTAQVGVALTQHNDGDDVFLRRSRYLGDIDRAGDFRVDNVPPGTYDLRVMGDNSLSERTVEVTANSVTRVDFEMPLVQIKVVVHVPGCRMLYLVSNEVRALDMCRDDIIGWTAIAPGAYRVCKALGDDTCAPITVAASPAEQRFEVSLPPDD